MQPKFKIGDKVKVKGIPGIYLIMDISHEKISNEAFLPTLYYIDNKYGWTEESELEHAN